MKSFGRPVRLLLINQLTINIGFYMLMPYLAAYLSGDLGLALWLTGLVLGVRNLSQQGLFLIGGTLADRLGYKPMILTGLILRTIGFGLLGLVESVPVLIVASVLTGLAGAFFNPAARAYLAQEAGERKVEAFALFNAFYQGGILIGPLIGLALQAVGFRVSCLVAAGLFAMLAAVQARALPARAGGAGARGSVLGDWRQVLRNRAFVLFSLAMIGSYVLSFQIYLALPLATGSPYGTAILFAVSGGLAMAGQVRLTAWVKARWTAEQAIVRGLWLMGVAFVPLGMVSGLVPALMTTCLLTVATMIVYPFEMATIATVGGDGLVGTYYGFYNTLSGIGIAAGTLLTGAAFDTGVPGLPWWGMVVLGCACALAMGTLARTGRLRASEPGKVGQTA
ncbi:MDR family MFS transporter [Nonomuraea sp. NPDC050663]|uniref:MDR family MFS transporter n=1 Tax=Nonomuraea sp. NPDC050663 TaxID=3364370 RepID=UPI0037B18042